MLLYNIMLGDFEIITRKDIFFTNAKNFPADWDKIAVTED